MQFNILYRIIVLIYVYRKIINFILDFLKFTLQKKVVWTVYRQFQNDILIQK